MLTYADLIDHALAYTGTDATTSATANYRRAVLNAYRIAPTRHSWSYYWAIARINTAAAYTTGTVAYDLTGGAYERMLTISDGTWPSWAKYGYVIISNIPYEVESRKSDTIITLTEETAPTADIASGTAFTIARDTYPLPTDYLESDETIINEIGTVMTYTHPRSWSSSRRLTTGPGRPVLFTVLSDPDTRDRMTMRIWPPPDTTYSMDSLYRKKARPMVYDRTADGLVSSSTTTITGVDTRFLSSHVGSVIRFASDSTDIPTGLEGGNPYFAERTITEFTSSTSVVVDSALPSEVSGVRYVISDPADIDTSVMQEYLLREVEKQSRLLTRTKPMADEDQMYQIAFIQALEADNRYSGRRASLRNQSRRTSLKYYPLDLGT
jgi:hypothetical protein